jgi:hypothetical protein
VDLVPLALITNTAAEVKLLNLDFYDQDITVAR